MAAKGTPVGFDLVTVSAGFVVASTPWGSKPLKRGNRPSMSKSIGIGRRPRRDGQHKNAELSERSLDRYGLPRKLGHDRF